MIDSQHPDDIVQDCARVITPYGCVILNGRVCAMGHPPAHWIAIEIDNDIKKMHVLGSLGQHLTQR